MTMKWLQKLLGKRPTEAIIDETNVSMETAIETEKFANGSISVTGRVYDHPVIEEDMLVRDIPEVHSEDKVAPDYIPQNVAELPPGAYSDEDVRRLLSADGNAELKMLWINIVNEQVPEIKQFIESGHGGEVLVKGYLNNVGQVRFDAGSKRTLLIKVEPGETWDEILHILRRAQETHRSNLPLEIPSKVTQAFTRTYLPDLAYVLDRGAAADVTYAGYIREGRIILDDSNPNKLVIRTWAGCSWENLQSVINSVRFQPGETTNKRLIKMFKLAQPWLEGVFEFREDDSFTIPGYISEQGIVFDFQSENTLRVYVKKGQRLSDAEKILSTAISEGAAWEWQREIRHELGLQNVSASEPFVLKKPEKLGECQAEAYHRAVQIEDERSALIRFMRKYYPFLEGPKRSLTTPLHFTIIGEIFEGPDGTDSFDFSIDGDFRISLLAYPGQTWDDIDDILKTAIKAGRTGVWRDIPDFPNYQIKKDGTIRNRTTRHILKWNGYKDGQVNLYRAGKKHHRTVSHILSKVWPITANSESSEQVIARVQANLAKNHTPNGPLTKPENPVVINKTKE